MGLFWEVDLVSLVMIVGEVGSSDYLDNRIGKYL